MYHTCQALATAAEPSNVFTSHPYRLQCIRLYYGQPGSTACTIVQNRFVSSRAEFCRRPLTSDPSCKVQCNYYFAVLHTEVHAFLVKKQKGMYMYMLASKRFATCRTLYLRQQPPEPQRMVLAPRLRSEFPPEVGIPEK